MARAGPEKAVRTCEDRVRPSYKDFINSFLVKMSNIPNFVTQEKKKGKARWSYNKMLID